MRRTLIGLCAGLALLLTVGGLALATLAPAPQEFAPFTMRTTSWTATASQRDGEAARPGTIVELLEYRSRDNWKVTVLSSTWNTGLVGTKVEVNNGTHSTFVSQAQKLFSRIIPQEEVGRVAPLPWVFPGLLDGLLGSSEYQSMSNSSAGTVTFIRRDSVTSTRADGTLEVLTGTLLVFDVASGLPVSRNTYRDGTLVESVMYEVVSRP